MGSKVYEERFLHFFLLIKYKNLKSYIFRTVYHYYLKLKN